MRNLKIYLFLLAMVGGKNLYAQQQGQLRIDSMVRALPQQKEDTNKVKLLREIAYVSYRVGQPDSTLKYAGLQLALAARLQWQKGLAYGNRMMGIGYEAKNELRKAIPNYEKALKLFEQISAKKAAEGAHELGVMYYSLNENAQAIQYFFKALKICESAGICDIGASCYTGIAVVYGTGKDYATAVEYHTKALRTAEKCRDIDSMDLLGKYMNLAVTYQRKGDCSASLPYCFKTLQLAEELGEVNTVANMYGNLSLAYTKLRDYEKAIDYGRRALALSDSVRDQQHVAWALYELGNAYLSFIADTASIGEGRKLSMGNMDAANKPAVARMAINYLERSLDSIRGTMNETEMTVRVYEELAKAYRLTGNWQKALLAHDMYLVIKDSIFSKETALQLQGQQMKYDFSKKEAETKALQEKKDIQQRNTRNAILAGMGGLLVFSLVVMRQRNRVRKEKANVESEKSKSEALLLNILPQVVAEELKTKGATTARHYDNVTVLFTDFANFTATSEKMHAQDLIDELHICFKTFDEITSKYNIEKIKTIGDAYLAVAGLPTADPSHAENIVEAAREITAFMEDRLGKMGSERTFRIRVGVHSGSVVAGIVGVKKFAYDIWGDTVNTAARMEQHGAAGRINISETTYNLVKDKINCEYRGEVEAKGKGVMKMYFVT